MTASDGEFEDVKNLSITIGDINEKPFFISTNKVGNILENDTSHHVVLDLDASDPDGDILKYKISGSNPSGAPFTINQDNGKYCYQLNL